jgi:type I restriction enzyme R subunit
LTIAWVNLVFRDKPGGLVVDYLGLADQLKHALASYTESGGKGEPTYDSRQVIAVMLEKHGYPADLQDEAVRAVLKQAELLCADWNL